MMLVLCLALLSQEDPAVEDAPAPAVAGWGRAWGMSWGSA